MEGKRILIVDDDPAIRRLLEAGLKRSGYEVDATGDGKTAVGLAQQKKPDLIILDIIMSGMDGTAVGGVLKEDSRTENIPIIFLTGLKSKEDKDADVGTGPIVLPKPFNMDVLLKKIDDLIRKKKL